MRSFKSMPARALGLIAVMVAALTAVPIGAMAQTVPGYELKLTPSGGLRETGTELVITATVENMVAGINAPVDVEWRASSVNDPDDSTSYDSPDESCVATDKNGDGTGSCTISYVGEEAGNDELVGWVDDDDNDSTQDLDTAEPAQTPAGSVGEPDDTDRIGNFWFVGVEEGSELDCNPETDTGFTSQEITYTCSVTDSSGDPVEGALVDLENLGGANDPDNSDGLEDNTTNTNPDYNNTCAWSGTPGTGASGRCEITLSAADGEVGSAELCFWVDEDPTWADDFEPLGVEERDGGRCDEEPRDEISGGDELLTDLVEKTWEVPDIKTGPCADMNYGTRRSTGSGGQVIAGSPSAEELAGTSGADVFCTFGGDDIVRGLGGNDQIYAGMGADELYGGEGSDMLAGGLGRDYLSGGALGDELVAGDGEDIVMGGFGRDQMKGEAGRDRLYGGDEADNMLGGSGNDYLAGNNGRDVLKGGLGLDQLLGGEGIDNCSSGSASDQGCEF
jgi:Ca2+-binding RTX toxin-like protein